MATVIKFPAPHTLDEILDELDLDAPQGLFATKEERAARYARMHRDAKARHARESFQIVT